MLNVLLDLAIALIVLIPLALIAYKKNLLTKSGLVAAFVVGLGVWMLASWAWFLIFLAFFIVTALFTHYKYQQKRSLGAAQDKSGARAWRNVMANGILPLGFVLVGFILIALGGGWDAYGRTVVGMGILFVPLPVMGITFAAFLGALATHCADTLATEIGLLNPTPPRLITKPWETVPAGTSGGVSLMGEVATIVGSLLIGGTAAFLAAPFWYAMIGAPPLFELVNFAPVTMVLVALFGGLIGCTIDSLFGATIQGHWRCQVCNKKTEKKVHCGQAADYLRGNRFFDNNMVNLVSGLIGAIAAIWLYLMLLSIGFA